MTEYQNLVGSVEVRCFEGNWLVCNPITSRGEYLVGPFSERKRTLKRWGVSGFWSSVLAFLCRASK